jgi:hypothetical protein
LRHLSDYRWQSLINCKIVILGLWFMIVIVIWCLFIITNVSVIVIVIASFFYLWNVCMMQGYDDILPHLFYHNSFDGIPSINIHDAIHMWSIMIMFIYDIHHCFIIWPFLEKVTHCANKLWICEGKLFKEMWPIYNPPKTKDVFDVVGIWRLVYMLKIWVMLCWLNFNFMNRHA